MDWFLHGRDLRHERVYLQHILVYIVYKYTYNTYHYNKVVYILATAKE